MDINQHIARAMSAAAILQDPESRGLAGSIALTQLGRAVKKIGSMPPELSHLTPERLEELRQANLIASADIALAKLRDPARDIQNRFEQLEHLEHYIRKADCGWQAVGLSQRDILILEFSLHCDRINRMSEDNHSLRHWEQEARRFLYKVDREDGLPPEEYAAYVQKLDSTVLEKKQALENSGYASAMEGLRSLRETTMPSKDVLDLVVQIRNSLHRSQKQGQEIYTITEELETRQTAAQKLNYKEQYEEILATGKGFEAVEAMEKIEREMEYSRWTWSDIGLDKTVVQNAKAVFNYDGLAQDLAEGRALLEQGDVRRAFSKVCCADMVLKRNDFNAIGRDTTEISGFYRKVLKLNLNEDFKRALDPEYGGCAAVSEIERIESRLRENEMDWREIDPSRDQKTLDDNISSIYLRAANEEAASYLDSRHEGLLNIVGWYLDKAGKNWADVEKIAEVKAAATAASHEFPALKAV